MEPSKTKSEKNPVLISAQDFANATLVSDTVREEDSPSVNTFSVQESSAMSSARYFNYSLLHMMKYLTGAACSHFAVGILIAKEWVEWLSCTVAGILGSVQECVSEESEPILAQHYYKSLLESKFQPKMSSKSLIHNWNKISISPLDYLTKF